MIKTKRKAGFPLELFCPKCGWRHVDADEWMYRAHHKHLCATCGNVWHPKVSPSRRATRGVQVARRAAATAASLRASEGVT